jgi:hypothetical protein
MVTLDGKEEDDHRLISSCFIIIYHIEFHKTKFEEAWRPPSHRCYSVIRQPTHGDENGDR